MGFSFDTSALIYSFITAQFCWFWDFCSSNCWFSNTMTVIAQCILWVTSGVGVLLNQSVAPLQIIRVSLSTGVFEDSIFWHLLPIIIALLHYTTCNLTGNWMNCMYSPSSFLPMARSPCLTLPLHGGPWEESLGTITLWKLTSLSSTLYCSGKYSRRLFQKFVIILNKQMAFKAM